MQADGPRAVRALTIEFRVTYCVVPLRLRFLRWSKALSLPWLRVSWVRRPILSDLPRLEGQLRRARIALGDEMDLREFTPPSPGEGHAD